MQPKPPSSGRRGSVIVVVLVVIVFASLLLTRMIESGSTDLLVAMREADRARLRADARDALETTLAVLEDFRAIDRALFTPSQGWDDPLGYAAHVPRPGVEVTVEFEEESGKLSLPRMDLATLTSLLEELGLPPLDATRVADALFFWMHKEHVPAEAATGLQAYEQSELPHVPPQRPLRSFDELAAVAVARDFFYDDTGRPTVLWTEFQRQVSLYDFEATNLNSASGTVLLATGWDAAQADSLTRYLGTKPIATDSPPYLRTVAEARREVGNAETRNLGTHVACLWIHVTAREGAAALRLSALVAHAGEASLPKPLAATDSESPAETGAEKPAASPGTRDADANSGGNALRYPYRVLQLVESIPSHPAP